MKKKVSNLHVNFILDESGSMQVGLCTVGRRRRKNLSGGERR